MASTLMVGSVDFFFKILWGGLVFFSRPTNMYGVDGALGGAGGARDVGFSDSI